ncbi:hypothetical protein DB346_16560 [Verrucomicrobia bacterium LW23]|nr:hypothetical protein DB346_16560 [Verrucomicrobia bacterium LW23]
MVVVLLLLPPGLVVVVMVAVVTTVAIATIVLFLPVRFVVMMMAIAKNNHKIRFSLGGRHHSKSANSEKSSEYVFHVVKTGRRSCLPN